MTKAEWEAVHGYRTTEHLCARCKHHGEYLRGVYETVGYTCAKKKEAGAGEIVKGSAECDLWEHENKERAYGHEKSNG